MGHANEKRDLSAPGSRRRASCGSRELPFRRALQRLRYTDLEESGRLRRERRYRLSTGSEYEF